MHRSRGVEPKAGGAVEQVPGPRSPGVRTADVATAFESYNFAPTTELTGKLLATYAYPRTSDSHKHWHHLQGPSHLLSATTGPSVYDYGFP